MDAVDLKRRVPARLVSADRWDSIEPGDCVVVTSAQHAGVVGGLAYACAGCGELVSLDLECDGTDGPRWSVVSGDPAAPETLTTSPSILHDPAKGGCGWHGYLTNGEFVPC